MLSSWLVAGEYDVIVFGAQQFHDEGMVVVLQFDHFVFCGFVDFVAFLQLVCERV